MSVRDAQRIGGHVVRSTFDLEAARMADTVRGASAVKQPLLDAVARALGARRAYLVLAGTQLPAAPRGRLLRRPRVHLLIVDVPDLRPAQQLVLELSTPPTPEDRLVSESLVRVFQPPRAPEHAERRAQLWDPTSAVAALRMPREARPEALLRAALLAARSRAGALMLAGRDPKVWTLGSGRPVLRRAAARVLEGETGTINVGGTDYLAIAVMSEDTLVGGFVAEEATDTPGVRAAVALMGMAVGPPEGRTEPEGVRNADPEMLRAALTAVPIAIVAVDSSGKLLGSSPEAETIFGLTDFDQGQSMRSRLGDLRLSDVLAGSAGSAETLVGEKWMEATIHRLPGGGRILVFTDRASGTDIQENQANLVAAMSHELRTPIAGVKALLEVIRMVGAKADPERIEGLLGDGIKEVGRLERLVEDLLLTARVATGGIQPHSDEIELRPVAESVVNHLQPRYPDRAFVVSGAAKAHADPSLVRHAVWHLADNAAKFGPETGRVDIELKLGPEGPEVVVTDQGPGIYSGDIPDLFRRFHRMERNAKSQHGGAGVGLYLVKSIVEAQGGTVWVRSRLGKGSTFGFRLPSARER